MIDGSEEINTIIIDNSCNNKALNFIAQLDIEKIDRDFSNLEKSDLLNLYSYKFNKHNLIFVQAKENLGYARGNNLGAKVSNALFNDKYYIFSNNDLHFSKRIYLNQLIDPFKYNDDIAIIGPKIIGMDGKPQSPRKKNNIWRQLILYFPNIILHDILRRFISNIDYTNNSKYTYWVMGCFIVVDKCKFNEIGMFDENTFLFAEEMILAERLLKKGYKNYFFNEITLIHNHGETVKDTFSTLKGIELSFKSNYYYFEKYIKCNNISLNCATYSFKLFKLIFPIKEKLKRFIRRCL
jgi:Predicted glycosyltransferases